MNKEIMLELYFEELEKKYFEKHNTWKIEEDILYSFSKEGIYRLINDTKKDYFEKSKGYKHIMMRKKFKEDYNKLNTLERYFIEKYGYFFQGGEEFERTKCFLDRIEGFYRVNYRVKNRFKNYVPFNINSIPITQILSHYITIPKNLNRNIRCPLHKEKTGSFRIYKNTNSFYCFGCHKGGGAVEFVSEFENISKKEAYKKLAKLYSK